MALSACLPVIAACAGPWAAGVPTQGDAQSTATVSALAGKVDFGAGWRQSAASMGEVARAATVSLIDASTTRTVSTTRTDDDGIFVLTFSGGFVPAANRAYVLEGVKGLSENLPGSDAVRVRTLARFDSGSWATITAGRVTINTSTTVLAIMQASYQAGNKTGPRATPGDYIGLIAGSGAPDSPDLLQGGQSVVDVSTYQRVYDYVREALTDSQDPVAAISYKSDADTFLMDSTTRPLISSLSVDGGPAGTEVTLHGNKFDGTDKTKNQVSFNGAPAEIVSASKTELTVVVPVDATTGPLSVTTDTGASNEVPFRVVRNFDGKFLASVPAASP